MIKRNFCTLKGWLELRLRVFMRKTGSGIHNYPPKQAFGNAKKVSI